MENDLLLGEHEGQEQRDILDGHVPEDQVRGKF